MVTKKVNIQNVSKEEILKGHFKQILISDNDRDVQIIKITAESNAQGLEHTHTNK